jgi:RNA polymerase sigma factor for flagellar operon FliA
MTADSSPASLPGGAPGPAEAPLPSYQGIAMDDIRLVASSEECAAALPALLAADALGFDTESKPTFVKGESSDGPHLLQLSTDSTAYLFQIGSRTPQEVVAAIRTVLEAPAILKVGFGLSDDVKRLRAKLGIEAAGVVDLSRVCRGNQRNELGAKSAVAKFFGQQLHKSKKTSTTNWASARLTERQLLYAANDAQVALRVFRRWLADGGKLPPAKAPRARAAKPA